jgi:hypothetical protein
MKWLHLFLGVFLFIGLGFIEIKLPSANQRIIAYIERVMGTEVGAGECWDLTVSAEYYAKASKKVSVKMNKVLPGDFISFKNVVIETNGQQMTLQNHFAIIYQIKENGVFIVAHQNHNGNRKVHLTEIDTNAKTKGTISITRIK